MPRLSYVSHEKKLVVFWTPKAACTPVVRWFTKSILGMWDMQGDPRPWLQKNGYILGWQDAYSLVGNGYKSIAFVREPRRRIVSAFLNKFFIYNGKKLSDFSQLEPFSKELVRSMAEQGGDQICFENLSFERFVSHLNDLKAKGERLDPHWNSQFPHDSECRVVDIPKFDWVVRQENFSADLAVLNRRLALRDYIPEKVNVTNFPETYSRTPNYIGNLGIAELHSQQLVPAKTNLFDSVTEAKLNELYRSDFLLLNKYYDDHIPL